MKEKAKALRKLASKLRKLASEKKFEKSAELDPAKVRDFLIFFGDRGNVR